MAVGCQLALMLMATMLTMTEAIPTPTPSGALLDARDCHIGQFKSLSPQQLQAFKRAKDAFVSPSVHFAVWECPVALEAELALTVKVLGTVADSALGAVPDQALHTQHHIHSKLRACDPAQPTAGPRPRGCLHRWLHRLQEATKMKSRGCLEDSVMYNLFRLLTQNLKYIASRNQCV
ncbi:interferon lambda-3-like [Loxodonta africana]|uniref:interferon lambda-3-like n=1 Tax=Loxodonta africana TaxID=9785 RepID=UPI0030CCFE8A